MIFSILLINFFLMFSVFNFKIVKADPGSCLSYLEQITRESLSPKEIFLIKQRETLSRVFSGTGTILLGKEFLRSQVSESTTDKLFVDENGQVTKRLFQSFEATHGYSGHNNLWVEDIITGKTIQLEGEFTQVEDIKFNSKGEEVKIIDASAQLRLSDYIAHRVFDTTSGKKIRNLHTPLRMRFPGEKKGLSLIKISSDFKLGLVKVSDRTFATYDYSEEEPRLLNTFKASKADMSDDGSFIVAKYEYTQKIFKITDLGLIEIIRSSLAVDHYSFGEKFSSDGRFVFIKDRLFSAAIYSLETGQLVSRFPLYRAHRIEMSPDGEFVLLIRNNNIIFIDPLTGLEKANFDLNPQGDLTLFYTFQSRVYFSEDNKKVGLKLPSGDGGSGLGPMFEYFIIDAITFKAERVNERTLF